jgi:putative membrane protein
MGPSAGGEPIEPVEPETDRRREPDYRFSLANERTFLAWIRTALAFLAGALAVGALDTDLDRDVAMVLRSACLVVAAVIAAFSYRRWAVVQAAMTAGTPMPPHPLLRPIAITVVLACIAIAVAFLR